MAEGTTATLELVQPALDHIIERPRLISLLERDARVTVFAAPAGYGKTTLARQWSTRQTGPVAWYRTTRASGDVAALAVEMDELLHKTVPQPQRDPKRIATIASVNSNPLPLARALVTTYASLTREVLLVVDEWEAAGTEEADTLLAHLVDELDIRFLITTRTRPDWFKPRLTVYGEALELGIDEFTMTEEEALAVLSAARPLPDPGPVISAARGWPAVLGLAALRAGPTVPTASARALYEYLTSELLESTAVEVRRSLNLLAVSSARTSATADLLLGENARRTLEDAVRLNLVRLEDDATFSLHPLLRDLLLRRVATANESERRSLLADLQPLISGQRWDETLIVIETLPDPSFASDALRGALSEILRPGRVTTLRRWVAACRDAAAEPALVDYADAELAWRDASFDRAIALGERAAASLPGDLAAKAHLAAARAANLADRLERARKHLAAAAALASSAESRAAARWSLFVQAVDEESPDEAHVLLQEFEAAAPSTPETTLRMAHGRLYLASIVGQLERCLDDAQVELAVADEAVDPLIRAGFLNICSGVALIVARYAEAMRFADHELRLASDFELEFVRLHALANRARAATGLRQLGVADRALAEIVRRQREKRNIYFDSNNLLERARLYLTIGDAERATGALIEDPDPRLNRASRGEHLALRGLALAALGRADDANSAIELARSASRTVEVRCLVACAEAVIDVDLGHERNPTDLLAELNALGGWGSLVLACRTSTNLAQHVASVKENHSRLIALLSASRDRDIARRIGLRSPRSRIPRGRLSPREREILELIAQGMTNPEISRLLYISPSTTKVHVRHIFEKLGVRSRVEAVRAWHDFDIPN